MKLAHLLEGIQDYQLVGNADRPIHHLCYDSRRIEPHDVFFAWKGAHIDGHTFIPEVCERQVAGIILEEAKFAGGLKGPAYVVVPNARHALAYLSSAYYGKPDHQLKVIGVTGTNGKTTTSFLIKHLLAEDPRQVGLIGTVRYEIGERVLPAKRTTPEALEVHQMLSEMVESGCRYVVLEASSHALDQGRLLGMHVDVGVFTNLSQDHLDYHGSMEKYLEAKKHLFLYLGKGEKPGVAVLNADESSSQKIEKVLGKEVRRIYYSIQKSSKADLWVEDLKITGEGTHGKLHAQGKMYTFSFPLVGSFNVSNALAALGAAWAVGVELEVAVERLASAPSVPGRLERFTSADGLTVMIDYAHTDDAIRQVLRTLRPLTRGRLMVVVGCGGERDKAKRPLMARAAVEEADEAIFTADNPRGEKVETILEDMVEGLGQKKNYQSIPDRREAIAEAIAQAQAGDVICVAGKGHEVTQEIGGKFFPFDDHEEVKRFLEIRTKS